MKGSAGKAIIRLVAICVCVPALGASRADAQYGQDNRENKGHAYQGGNQTIIQCNAPGSCAPGGEAQEQKRNSASRLEYAECATVLEAVKTCETLGDCSRGSMQGSFGSSEMAFFRSIDGGVFSVSNFFDQCSRTCRSGNYRLQPTRSVLCGY